MRDSGPLGARGVVIASNRAPVTFVEQDGGYVPAPGIGSLAASLRRVVERLPARVAWVATTSSELDRRAVAAGSDALARAQLDFELRFVAVDGETYERYYEDVSNRLLWVANHDLWAEVGHERASRVEPAAWGEAYEAVNAAVARAAARVARPGDVCLLQDFQLATAARHLRALTPHRRIGHFTHTPFARPESLAQLPSEVAHGLVHGMLGADLLGFHAARWCGAFLDACERFGMEVDRAEGVVRHGSRSVWVRAHPIPIDAERVRERAFAEPATAWARRFAAGTSGPLIVRVDRIDPAKNVVRGFEAFGRVLDSRPDLRDARFVACLYGTRQSMAEYRLYAERIEAAAAAVNSRHPAAIELFMDESYDRALGALRVYDVLLVNPLADGMNLVAQEGPSVNERHGALALSSMAGAFDRLGEHAVAIGDPADVRETADALCRALDMGGDERRRRGAALRALVEQRTPADWLDAQLADLDAIGAGCRPAQ